MVDFEKRNLSFRDPYLDNHFEFNRNTFSVERYKSSKNDDFKYSINYRMNRSNQSDFNTCYRHRSRSRENYRINNNNEDEPLSNSYINTRVHNYSERRYLLDYPPPEFERSRSYNYLDSYEYDMEFVTYEDYYESSIYTEHNGLGDDLTNKENIESKMTLMVDNSRNRNGRINSLLGDGPEHLRIYPSKYEHFEEDIYYVQGKLINDVDDIKRNNKYENLNNPISVNSEQNLLSKSDCLENKVSVFDYNHQNPVSAINLEKSALCNPENNFGKYNKSVSSNISSNCIADSEIDQGKTVSNVLKIESVRKTNVSLNCKWILLPLDAPLRVSISADNINLAKCSKKDPRIEHII